MDKNHQQCFLHNPNPHTLKKGENNRFYTIFLLLQQ